MKTYTKEDILADAEAQMEKYSDGSSVKTMPEEITQKGLQVMGKHRRVKSLREKLVVAEAEVEELEKAIGAYLAEHPSGFFLGRVDRPEKDGIQRYADFSEVGGKPEIPTGEEAREVLQGVLALAAAKRYQARKAERKAQKEAQEK